MRLVLGPDADDRKVWARARPQHDRSTFSVAPTTKNGVVDPVAQEGYGNARLVTNEPRFPAMFIVPATTPARSRPMSIQNDP
jgi:hypothetical protein